MAQLVVLNLGAGHWQQGFPTVTAQLWHDQTFTPVQFTGSLPPAPQLATLYARWQQVYAALYAHKSWRGHVLDFELEEDDITQVSQPEFAALCDDLKRQFNRWLAAESFGPVERKLRTQLSPHDEIRCIITAGDRSVLRFPWCLWQWLDDYPRCELALSLPDYSRVVNRPVQHEKVGILAILGNSQGIDVLHDRQLLEQLPQVDLKLLVEPDSAELTDQLWKPGWDILFFAGHSSSQQGGQIQLNRSDHLSLRELRYSLQQAIAHGLKLAIFNSCDGLELAWELADLNIPQVIVMREPVPDPVAQAFLKHFLVAFAQGESLYLAVKQARQRLQVMERTFPCATWLPIICQNPAEPSPTWNQWCQPVASVQPVVVPSRAVRPTPRLKLLLAAGVLVTLGVMGLRSLGWLQAVELSALDRMMRLRPAEPSDERLLIVTLSEADIQQQDAEQRRGSLSDATLAQLINQLMQHQPRAIGLDVYRDFPTQANYPQLATALQQNDRLIAICKGLDAKYDPTGIAPPPEVPDERVGFSDFIEDADGIVRRQLLTMSPDPASPCATPYSFNARLVFRYLESEAVPIAFTPEGNLKIGDRVFPRLRAGRGGYQQIDDRGNQILLNYRSLPPLDIAPQVSLQQVLNGQLRPEAVRDRIVLIGVTANSAGDLWSTPFETRATERVPGVFLQAQMTSQMLSAVLDDRPLLTTWSLPIDGLWVLGWAVVGSGLVVLWGDRPYWQYRAIAAGGMVIGLAGVSLLLLLGGVWVPWVPSGIAVLLTSGIALYGYPKSFTGRL